MESDGCYLEDNRPFQSRLIRSDNPFEVTLKIASVYRNWDHFDSSAEKELFDCIVPVLFLGNFSYPLQKRIRQVRDALNKCKTPYKIEHIADILEI